MYAFEESTDRLGKRITFFQEEYQQTAMSSHGYTLLELGRGDRDTVVESENAKPHLSDFRKKGC